MAVENLEFEDAEEDWFDKLDTFISNLPFDLTDEDCFGLWNLWCDMDTRDRNVFRENGPSADLVMSRCLGDLSCMPSEKAQLLALQLRELLRIEDVRQTLSGDEFWPI